MLITLKRIYKGEGYTIGKLYIDGAYICDTLEDKDRGLTSAMTEAEIAKIKVYGQTAIPTGEYKVTMTMSSRFKKVLPLLNGVKGYSGVRIHSGNTAKDTEGCILCGKNTEKGKVTNSRYWTDIVIAKIKSAKSEVRIRIL